MTTYSDGERQILNTWSKPALIEEITKMDTRLAASQSALQDAADLCDRQGKEIGEMRDRIDTLEAAINETLSALLEHGLTRAAIALSQTAKIPLPQSTRGGEAMSRDMTIVVMCDHCENEIEIDLESGNVNDDYDVRVEKSLLEAGWYSNLDGDYCPKCKEQAKREWERQ